jgi:CHAD domain-containing protein
MKPAHHRASEVSQGVSRGDRDLISKRDLERLARSLKKQWKRYRKELKRCQNEFSEEAIHESRVEARRLIASAALLGGFTDAACLEKLEASLKEHLDAFDDLRDTQVQLASVGGRLRDNPGGRAFRAYLGKREERFVRRTRKRIGRFGVRKLEKAVDAFRHGVEKELAQISAGAAASALLRSVNRAFLRTRSLRGAIDPNDTKSIHRARVAFKKFRYMVESLAKYLPGVTEDYFDEMRHYQTMMGEIQDAEVLLKTFDRYVARKGVDAAIAKPLRAELARRRLRLIRVYLDAADQLLDFWPLRSCPAFAPRNIRMTNP